MRVVLCVAAVLWLCAGATAQEMPACTLTFEGVVLDEHDDDPLSFATIWIVDLERGTAADDQGRFRITGLCPGNYTVRFSHVGCETRERVVRLRGDLDIVLRLEHHAELLETIELTARRIREAGATMSDGLDRHTVLLQSGRTLGEMLQTLPGVNALQTGPAVFKPVIHGLHSNRVLLINDGVRLESQQWGLDHAPEIDPNSAGEITVVKGSAAVQYGADAVAGVILVEPVALPRERTFDGNVRLTAMSNGRQFAVASTLNRGFGRGFGMRFNVTARRAGDFHAPDYQLTNTGIIETHAGLAAGFQKGLHHLRLSYSVFRAEVGILRSAHIGNLTDLQEALQRDRPFFTDDFSYRIGNPRQRVLHHTVRLAGQRHLRNAGILQGYYAIQWNARQEYDIRRGGRSELPAIDLDLQSHTGSVTFAHDRIGHLKGKFGLHWIYQHNRNIPGTGVRPLIPNYTRYTPAVSWVEKWIAHEVEIEAGVRYEYVHLQVRRFDMQNVLERPEFHFHNVSASAGARWDATDRITVYTHAGRTNRAPHVNELYSEGLHHGAAAIEEGDSALVPEKAIKWVSGIEVRTERVQADVSFYAQGIRDFIYLRPSGMPRLTIRGAFPVFQYVQHDARLWGAEGSVRINLTSQWQWSSAAALVRAYNRSLDEHLIHVPPDRMQHSIVWSHRSGAFDAGIALDHVWRQSLQPVHVDYSPAPPGYTLLHLRINTDVIDKRLSAHLTVRNLLNTSYREYLNRLRYYADDAGRNVELRLIYAFE